jgi:hypothetical protein
MYIMGPQALESQCFKYYYKLNSLFFINIVISSCVLLQLMPLGKVNGLPIIPPSRLQPCTMLAMQDGPTLQYSFPMLLHLHQLHETLLWQTATPPRIVHRLTSPILVSCDSYSTTPCSTIDIVRTLCSSPVRDFPISHKFLGARLLPFPYSCYEPKLIAFGRHPQI